MTNRKKVLKRYPKAHYDDVHYVTKSKESGIVLAAGATCSEAWERAAARVERDFRWRERPEILEFIADFERSHFRTTQDTGANPSAMMLWNMVRHRAGLEMISKDDLPRYDPDRQAYVLPEGSRLSVSLIKT